MACSRLGGATKNGKAIVEWQYILGLAAGFECWSEPSDPISNLTSLSKCVHPTVLSNAICSL